MCPSYYSFIYPLQVFKELEAMSQNSEKVIIINPIVGPEPITGINTHNYVVSIVAKGVCEYLLSLCVLLLCQPADICTLTQLVHSLSRLYSNERRLHDKNIAGYHISHSLTDDTEYSIDRGFY